MFLFLTFIVKAQVGVGTTTPNAKSMLDITSVEKGVLIPRLTHSQILAITPGTVENGLFVYNTNENCFNFWNGTSWQSLCGGNILSDFTIDCTQFPAADNNVYSVGGNVSGEIIVNVKVIKEGPYFITVNSSDNSVNYSSTGEFTSAQVGTTVPVTLLGGGTPSSAPVNFSVNGNGNTICNYTKSAATNAIYSCNGATVNGTFEVATKLGGQSIIVTLNVSQAGIVNLETQDRNGIKLASGVKTLAAGNQTVTLVPVEANSGVFPMTAEETSNGNNGSDNQSSTYIIKNLATSQDLSCTVRIDVKPKVWTVKLPIGGVRTIINGPVNGNVSLFMQDQNAYNGGNATYFKVWVENNSSTNWTDVSTRTRSGYEPAYLLSWNNGTITPNERLGSLDGYLQAALGTARPSFTGEYGAHGGPQALFPNELSDNGLVFKWTAPESGNIFSGTGAKYYKYRVTYKSFTLGQTVMNLILFGLYDNKPQTWEPSSSIANDGGYESIYMYWP